MNKDIIIRFIPHKKQNYETCGDYGEIKGWTWFSISKFKDWRYPMLILIHEIIEYTLCKWRGIKSKEITAFDIKFEQNRQLGNTDEPGDHPLSPYRKEHQFATKIERMIAEELGVDWSDYDDKVTNL